MSGKAKTTALRIFDILARAEAKAHGVDSAFLLKTAQNVLGEHVIAITAKPCSFPLRELEEARAFYREIGIRQIVFGFNELEIVEGFRENPPNRCYLCKKELFGQIIRMAHKQNISYTAEGSNMDDNGDYRPGMVSGGGIGDCESSERVRALLRKKSEDCQRR